MEDGARTSFGRAALIFLAAGFIAFFVGLPLAAIFAEAVHGGITTLAGLWNSSDAWHAAQLTIGVTALTLCVNAVAGTFIAWTLTKYRFKAKALLTTIVDLPLSISPVVVGLAVLFSFGLHSRVGGWLAEHHLKIVFAFPGLVIATIFVTFPFIARELIALMDEQGRELEEAALIMGASTWTTFWKVTLPNAKVALADGAILCGARAMGEFGAVSVVSGRIRGQTETMPLHIEALYNDYNIAGAFSMALLLVLITLVAIAGRALMHRRRLLAHTASAKRLETLTLPDSSASR